MKTRIYLLQIAFMLLACAIARGQAIFIYDQQSQTNQSGGGGAPIQSQQPTGQSFTPSLSGVGFAQFEFLDVGGSGATVYLNLWADSIGGTFLGSTSNGPVFIPGAAFNYVTNFLFSSQVAVTPGTTYYLQPVVQSGDANLDIVVGNYNYPGGTFYWNGAPDPSGGDLWFREGIIAVPEPSTFVLIVLGTVTFIFRRRR